ncbi:hypothetical protein ACP4OV_021290 [Aristida adscensionis]
MKRGSKSRTTLNCSRAKASTKPTSSTSPRCLRPPPPASPSQTTSPMAAPRSWANLPLDAICEVTRRVLCSNDRLEVALAYRTWRAALARTPPPPPPLPWLLLPSDDSAHLYCMLRGRRIDHGFNDEAIGGRCFGSHDGALFVAMHHPPQHRLVEYRVEEKMNHVLPKWSALYTRSTQAAATCSSSPPPSRPARAGCLWRTRTANPRPLASSPTSAFDFPPPPPPPDDLNSAMEDVLYCNGALNFLTSGEDILLCRPDFSQDDGADDDDDGPFMMLPWLCRFVPRDRSCDAHVRARYLVESGEDLLMVVRFSPQPHMLTSEFKVFRAIRQQMPNSGGGGGGGGGGGVPGYTWS